MKWLIIAKSADFAKRFLEPNQKIRSIVVVLVRLNRITPKELYIFVLTVIIRHNLVPTNIAILPVKNYF